MVNKQDAQLSIPFLGSKVDFDKTCHVCSMNWYLPSFPHCCTGSRYRVRYLNEKRIKHPHACSMYLYMYIQHAFSNILKGLNPCFLWTQFTCLLDMILRHGLHFHTTFLFQNVLFHHHHHILWNRWSIHDWRGHAWRRSGGNCMDPSHRR